MRDLGDLMWSAVDERARTLDGLVPDAAGMGDLRARVRRGRTVRHVREAAVALPVVAAVAAAGWFGVGRLTQAPPLPPATPDVVEPGPDGTPVPSATSTPDEEPALGEPIVEPGLPPYHAMPDGLLERTGPGWVVTSHRPTRYLAATDEHEVLGAALFVVDPEGTHYLVGRFSPDALVAPVAWEAGSATVDVVVDTVTAGYADERPEQDLMAATYDLHTGEFAPREADDVVWPPVASPADAWLVAPGGDRVLVGAELGDTFVLARPDGSGRAEAAYGVAGKDCAPVGWLSRESFLALCVDDGAPGAGGSVMDLHPVLVEVLLGGDRSVTVTELRALAAGDPIPEAGAGAWVRDGVVVFPSVEPGPGGCWTGAHMWTGGGFAPVQGPQGAEDVFRVATAGGLVLVEGVVGCSGDAAPGSLTLHDPGTGASRVLEAAVPDWRPGEPGGVTAGLFAWTPAR